MRNHKYGTLARWILQLAPGALICALVVVARPPSEWPTFVGFILLYVLVLVGFVAWIVRDRRVDQSLRDPGTVAFVVQNVPGAIVHLERFIVPDATLARGPSFVIVADNAGLGYYPRGKDPVAFIRIPWSEIASIDEMAGELGVTMADGSLLAHIPGGMLPMGARRVRALAAEVSRLQPARQL